MPKMDLNRRNPLGTRGLRIRSALFVVDDDTASPPPPALIVPRKTLVSDLLDFYHGLLARQMQVVVDSFDYFSVKGF